MLLTPMPRLSPRLVSHGLFAAGGVLAVIIELGPVILAYLFSYMTLHVAHFLIGRRVRAFWSRWLALAVFAIVAVGMGWTFFHAIQQTLSTLPKILATVTPKIIEIGGRLGFELPFENINELHVLLMTAVKDHALVITRFSGIATTRFLLLIGGLLIAVLYFMTEAPRKNGTTLADSLRQEVGARVGSFMLSFEKVLGAQVVISAVNTVLTAIFLAWCDMPYMAFLVPATFILGVIPLVGNVVSNALICATALTLSLKLAVLALAFLVFIHTLEHFLNSRIIGHSIGAPMWQTLIAILLGEATMGVPGILLAPAIWHYVREELSSIPAAPPEAKA